MTDTTKPVPCPFCDGESFIDACDRVINIGCKTCGYSRAFRGLLQTNESPVRVSEREFYHRDAKEEAIAAWNRRPSPSVHRQASAGQEGVLTGAEIDTLIALVELGPLADGDVPSKSGRDGLVTRGLAARILVNGQDGYQAATYAGREAYQSHYGAETTEEATANRITTRTIRNARKDAQ